MVIASIIIPNWVSYTVTTPRGDRIERHVGLHKVCMNIETPNCKPYPTPKFCEAGEQAFCDMWRTVGFMASLSAIMCLASLVCFLVVMTGGKYKRETGWPFVSGMLTLVSFVDIAIISFVVGLHPSLLAGILFPASQGRRVVLGFVNNSLPYIVVFIRLR